MIDERRVREMACEYNTNHSTARQLLEGAQDVPALRIGRRYREMTGGDAGGQKNTEAVPGAEKGAGADRQGDRTPSGAGGEHPDGDGKGHRIQP